MKNKFNPLAVAVVCVFLAVILWVLWIVVAYWIYPNEVNFPESAKNAAALRGQFGDMFGGINSIFTALILAGSFYTIYLQHIEIRNIEHQSQAIQTKDETQIRLMAYMALINARTATLNTRQRIIENSSIKTVDNILDVMLADVITNQAKEAVNDFDEINRLSKDIEKILENYLK
jgi:hypothetical protein